MPVGKEKKKDLYYPMHFEAFLYLVELNRGIVREEEEEEAEFQKQRHHKGI